MDQAYTRFPFRIDETNRTDQENFPANVASNSQFDIISSDGFYNITGLIYLYDSVNEKFAYRYNCRKQIGRFTYSYLIASLDYKNYKDKYAIDCMDKEPEWFDENATKEIFTEKFKNPSNWLFNNSELETPSFFKNLDKDKQNKWVAILVDYLLEAMKNNSSREDFYIGITFNELQMDNTSINTNDLHNLLKLVLKELPRKIANLFSFVIDIFDYNKFKTCFTSIELFSKLIFFSSSNQSDFVNDSNVIIINIDEKIKNPYEFKNSFALYLYEKPDYYKKMDNCEVDSELKLIDILNENSIEILLGILQNNINKISSEKLEMFFNLLNNITNEEINKVFNDVVFKAVTSNNFYNLFKCIKQRSIVWSDVFKRNLDKVSFKNFINQNLEKDYNSEYINFLTDILKNTDNNELLVKIMNSVLSNNLSKENVEKLFDALCDKQLYYIISCDNELVSKSDYLCNALIKRYPTIKKRMDFCKDFYIIYKEKTSYQISKSIYNEENIKTMSMINIMLDDIYQLMNLINIPENDTLENDVYKNLITYYIKNKFLKYPDLCLSEYERLSELKEKFVFETKESRDEFEKTFNYISGKRIIEQLKQDAVNMQKESVCYSGCTNSRRLYVCKKQRKPFSKLSFKSVIYSLLFSDVSILLGKSVLWILTYVFFTSFATLMYFIIERYAMSSISTSLNKCGLWLFAHGHNVLFISVIVMYTFASLAIISLAFIDIFAKFNAYNSHNIDYKNEWVRAIKIFFIVILSFYLVFEILLLVCALI